MTKKTKDDFHKVFERVHFSKYFKRRVLLEYARVKNANEAFRVCGFEIDEESLGDKKYAAKLLYKWRKELYQNYHLLSFMNCEMTDEVLRREIESLKSEDDKTDRVMELMRPYIENPDDPNLKRLRLRFPKDKPC